jgi:hypothetical protein
VVSAARIVGKDGLKVEFEQGTDRITAAGTTQVWDDQPSVKVDVLSTGTSFSAALARNSADPVVHNRIGADQRLYGPLHVNTAVADIGEPTESRSIGAAIKLNWKAAPRAAP